MDLASSDHDTAIGNLFFSCEDADVADEHGGHDAYSAYRITLLRN